MSKQTTPKRRLFSLAHRRLAYLLDAAYGFGSGPRAPRSIRAKLTHRLGQLAEDAGINRNGLTAKETYLAAVRALDGRETARTQEIRALAYEWSESRGAWWKKCERTAATTSITTTNDDAPEVSLPLIFDNEGEYCFLGIAGGYVLIADGAADLRVGHIAALQTAEDRKNTWFTVGRVVSISADEITIKDVPDRETTYQRACLVWMGLVDLNSQEKRAALSTEDRERVDALRACLGKMDADEIPNCTAAMKIERKIYDIEHATDSDLDDWSAWEEDEQEGGAR